MSRKPIETRPVGKVIVAALVAFMLTRDAVILRVRRGAK